MRTYWSHNELHWSRGDTDRCTVTSRRPPCRFLHCSTGTRSSLEKADRVLMFSQAHVTQFSTGSSSKNIGHDRLERIKTVGLNSIHACTWFLLAPFSLEEASPHCGFFFKISCRGFPSGAELVVFTHHSCFYLPLFWHLFTHKALHTE